MTDDFYAQARVNRLALNFGLPSLCAQVYAEGRGAEVTFTHPEVTRACHRCILQSRYDAYLLRGFRNTTTSSGTPFYATARLNAIKQWIALALLHHNSAHPRWSGMLGRIDQRNLAQLRLDPDSDLPGVQQAFLGADPLRLFSDEAVWLPQNPTAGSDGEPCPDCYGSGDLRASIGLLGESRIHRAEQ
jgi:hypothetical protein